jgi:hypothetical protein
MVQVPWPITSAPGKKPQEGAGRLINVFIERRGDNQSIVWRRAPGATLFSHEPSVGLAEGHSIALGVSQVVDVEGMAAGDSSATGES